MLNFGKEGAIEKLLGPVGGVAVFVFGALMDMSEVNEKNKKVDTAIDLNDIGNRAKAFGIEGQVDIVNGEVSISHANINTIYLAANLYGYNQKQGTSKTLTEIWNSKEETEKFVKGIHEIGNRYFEEIRKILEDGELTIKQVLSEKDIALIVGKKEEKKEEE